MYKLLIFDWDGTLIDSADRIIASMQAAARDCNVPVPDAEAVRNIIGLGLPEAIRLLIPGIDQVGVEEMRRQYGAHFLEIDQTPMILFPGVRESLERMHQKGVRMAVATGKSRRGLDRGYKQTGLGPLFETSRCADETTSKPDPHMLHEILEETGVAPHEALMIGDTEYDLEMGQRAGTGLVAVSYGAHPLHRLEPYKPVLKVDQFMQLEAWLAPALGW
ncbi:HAD-IA family hydrolase [Pontibacter sp. JAM-7]|uniref:HAD-IA family hydrolase n=1 Tax=Pontibacter sp. JAM-7 TaxID=3366581 RepID=UPI003AF98505